MKNGRIFKNLAHVLAEKCHQNVQYHSSVLELETTLLLQVLA